MHAAVRDYRKAWAIRADGTDLINARYSVELAARKEYTIMFPAYYFGQIFEAKHQPGTVAYSTRLQLELLRETVSEMARNGCKKVIITDSGKHQPDWVYSSNVGELYDRLRAGIESVRRG